MRKNPALKAALIGGALDILFSHTLLSGVPIAFAAGTIKTVSIKSS